MTDCACPPGDKLRFLGLGFLGLTKSQVPGTEGASPAGKNVASIQETHLSDANKVRPAK